LCRFRKTAVNIAPKIAYNELPLDLPHAGRIAARLCRVIENRAQESFQPGYEDVWEIAAELNELLFFCRLENEAPVEGEESERLRQTAATLGRRIVAELERHRFMDDRIGQCIRNLFECLALGEEGAILSLRAGENPHSLQRPYNI
jgi:hypothetical protein